MNQHFEITDCLKATPAEEGGRRYVYIEASNESRDAQGEIVLAKALAESADYYRKFGNLDLDHITQVGAKAGIPDYHFYEIGRPVDVQAGRDRTFVKGEIAQGEGKSAERANDFWKSITKQDPPQIWYPSIGGQVLGDATITKDGVESRAIVKVRWTNIGFSKTPVNLEVQSISTIPIGAFAKAWSSNGLDLAKALTSTNADGSVSTDSADLTGGAATRKQSLDRTPKSYWDFRENMAKDLVSKNVKGDGAAGIHEHATGVYGLPPDVASDWTTRFMTDVSHDLKKRRQK